MSDLEIPTHNPMTTDHTKPAPLDDDERGDLRDWLDTSGTWANRIGNLYRLVEAIVMKRQRQAMTLAWEQGWVARGNQYDADDNPYRLATAPVWRCEHGLTLDEACDEDDCLRAARVLSTTAALPNERQTDS